MKRPKFTVTAIAALILSVGLMSCADLFVENLNAPDSERALNNPDDITSILTGGWLSWWRGTNGNRASSAHFDGWADVMTTTNNYELYWEAAVAEPRNRIDNSTSWGGTMILTTPWNNINSAISSANDVIRAVEQLGFSIETDGGDQTDMVHALAYLLRGVSLGYLANMFDQAYLVNEDTDVSAPLQLHDYHEVLEAGLTDIDRAIQISQNNSFVTLEFLNGITPSSAELVQFANSYAAKFIISNGRTASHYDSSIWERVRQYASNGITGDLAIEATGTSGTWRHEYQRQSGLDWYWKSDLRIINLLDPEYPMRYPPQAAGRPITQQASSDDARLATDFRFDPFNMSRFNIDRGRELQSVYYYVRYEPLYLANGLGQAPFFLKAQNDMILAESMVHLGDVPGAIEILNNGPRTTRGQLEPIPSSASAEEVLDAIYYEIDIELQRTSVGYQFFTLRRRDALQVGTPLHLPIPASELNISQTPIYTFGGAGRAAEEGTADGSNQWDQDWNPDDFADW